MGTSDDTEVEPLVRFLLVGIVKIVTTDLRPTLVLSAGTVSESQSVATASIPLPMTSTTPIMRQRYAIACFIFFIHIVSSANW